ncbi:Protein ELC [Linum grandiflorum]
MSPPPAGPSPPPSPAVQQFLSTVLSQGGPSALPYSEDTKWLIRQHLLALAAAYPSLKPKTATFTHNDGRSANLLQAGGTIPMAFKGVTYNIPIIIWLVDSYPRQPPSVFVNPTRDMIIKRPHSHVNPSGNALAQTLTLIPIPIPIPRSFLVLVLPLVDPICRIRQALDPYQGLDMLLTTGLTLHHLIAVEILALHGSNRQMTRQRFSEGTPSIR